MEKRPILSISVLASNRQDTIRRCLDSLLPIMKQIPSELILVDTSTDTRIRPILEEYTDTIISFTWCNDFSKARNAGLAQAKGEWFLFIDDDEWFVEIEELIHFFKSGEYKKYGCANYIQRNFHDADWIHYSDSWVSRMIKRNQSTHFESKIHEYLVPVLGECKNINVIANHTGYIFMTEEDARKRFERNSVLLLEMIEEEPERLRWRVQLAQEYNSAKMWEKLEEFCEENLAYTKNRNNSIDNRDIGTFYAGAIESLIALEQYQKAKEIGQRALQDKRCSELCQAYMYLRLAVLAFRTKQWQFAQKCIEAYFMIKEALEQLPDRLANQKGALLVNDAFDDISVKRAYSILIGCELKQGSTNALQQYFSLLEWNQKVIYVFMDIIPVLIEAMAILPYEPIFTEVMQSIWNNAELQNTVFPEIHAWEERNRNAYYQLLRIMLDITGEHWYIWYGKIIAFDNVISLIKNEAVHTNKAKFEETFGEDFQDLNGKQQQDLVMYLQGLQQALEGFFATTKNIFLTPENVAEIAIKYQISLEDLYLSVPFEKWKKHLHEYIEKVEKQDLILLEQAFVKMKTRENIRYEYFSVRIAEANVLYSVREREFAQKRQALLTYLGRAMVFLRTYYKELVIKSYMELLPAYGQAAILLEQAFLLEEENPKEMLRILEQIPAYYPSFESVIKSYLQAYDLEQVDKKWRAREAFEEEKGKILMQVHQCLKKKQYELALEQVQTLKEKEPENLEWIALSLEIRLAMVNNPDLRLTP